MLFDPDYKLLQSEDFLNNKVNFNYGKQNFGPDSVTDPEGKLNCVGIFIPVSIICGGGLKGS